MAKKKAENTENIKVEQKPTSYLISFDSDGRRLETYIANEYSDEAKAEMLEKGFVEISEADWRYYAGLEGTGDNGTGYVRDPETGKPISAPAHIPSTEEKLARLEYDYAAEKARLREYMSTADLMQDDETKAELQAEYAELEAWYTEEYDKIIQGGE